MARTRVVRSRLVGVGAALLLAACGPSAADTPAHGGDDRTATAEGTFSARSYERNFVFASLDGDSIFLVPWLLETVATPDTVTREAGGWLARGGIWEAFYDERWDGPPSRAPARVLPHGNLSFVVREGDAVDGIIFEEGPRRLELVLGDVRATWVGPRGETFELLDGAAYLSDQRVEGVVLDMARASGGGALPGGDWAFLLSGDSAYFVLAADTEYGGETDPSYRAWAEFGESELQWPELHVDWRDEQAFPPARRDVPVAWRIWSSDGLIEGELEAVSAEIRAGTGPGPLLPVRALFEVVGDISTVKGNFPVRGLFVHERR